jgi:hypothetical protein
MLFFKTPDGVELIRTPDILSLYINIHPSKSAPNDLSIKPISIINSVDILEETSSDPLIDISKVS